MPKARKNSKAKESKWERKLKLSHQIKYGFDGAFSEKDQPSGEPESHYGDELQWANPNIPEHFVFQPSLNHSGNRFVAGLYHALILQNHFSPLLPIRAGFATAPTVKRKALSSVESKEASTTATGDIKPVLESDAVTDDVIVTDTVIVDNVITSNAAAAKESVLPIGLPVALSLLGTKTRALAAMGGLTITGLLASYYYSSRSSHIEAGETQSSDTSLDTEEEWELLKQLSYYLASLTLEQEKNVTDVQAVPYSNNKMIELENQWVSYTLTSISKEHDIESQENKRGMINAESDVLYRSRRSAHSVPFFSENTTPHHLQDLVTNIERQHNTTLESDYSFYSMRYALRSQQQKIKLVKSIYMRRMAADNNFFNFDLQHSIDEVESAISKDLAMYSSQVALSPSAPYIVHQNGVAINSLGYFAEFWSYWDENTAILADQVIEPLSVRVSELEERDKSQGSNTITKETLTHKKLLFLINKIKTTNYGIYWKIAPKLRAASYRDSSSRNLGEVPILLSIMEGESMFFYINRRLWRRSRTIPNGLVWKWSLEVLSQLEALLINEENQIKALMKDKAEAYVQNALFSYSSSIPQGLKPSDIYTKAIELLDNDPSHDSENPAERAEIKDIYPILISRLVSEEYYNMEPYTELLRTLITMRMAALQLEHSLLTENILYEYKVDQNTPLQRIIIAVNSYLMLGIEDVPAYTALPHNGRAIWWVGISADTINSLEKIRREIDHFHISLTDAKQLLARRVSSKLPTPNEHIIAVFSKMASDYKKTDRIYALEDKIKLRYLKTGQNKVPPSRTGSDLKEVTSFSHHTFSPQQILLGAERRWLSANEQFSVLREDHKRGVYKKSDVISPSYYSDEFIKALREHHLENSYKARLAEATSTPRLSDWISDILTLEFGMIRQFYYYEKAPSLIIVEPERTREVDENSKVSVYSFLFHERKDFATLSRLQYLIKQHDADLSEHDFSEQELEQIYWLQVHFPVNYFSRYTIGGKIAPWGLKADVPRRHVLNFLHDGYLGWKERVQQRIAESLIYNMDVMVDTPWEVNSRRILEKFRRFSYVLYLPAALMPIKVGLVYSLAVLSGTHVAAIAIARDQDAVKSEISLWSFDIFMELFPVSPIAAIVAKEGKSILKASYKRLSNLLKRSHSPVELKLSSRAYNALMENPHFQSAVDSEVWEIDQECLLTPRARIGGRVVRSPGGGCFRFITRPGRSSRVEPKTVDLLIGYEKDEQLGSGFFGTVFQSKNPNFVIKEYKATPLGISYREGLTQKLEDEFNLLLQEGERAEREAEAAVGTSFLLAPEKGTIKQAQNTVQAMKMIYGKDSAKIFNLGVMVNEDESVMSRVAVEMQKIPGHSLQDIMEGGVISSKGMRAIMKDIDNGSAMRRLMWPLKQHGIDHGDMNVQNIMVDASGDRVDFNWIDFDRVTFNDELHIKRIDNEDELVPAPWDESIEEHAERVRKMEQKLQRTLRYARREIRGNYASSLFYRPISADQLALNFATEPQEAAVCFELMFCVAHAEGSVTESQAIQILRTTRIGRSIDTPQYKELMGITDSTGSSRLPLSSEPGYSEDSMMESGIINISHSAAGEERRRLFHSLYLQVTDTGEKYIYNSNQMPLDAFLSTGAEAVHIGRGVTRYPLTDRTIEQFNAWLRSERREMAFDYTSMSDLMERLDAQS